MSMQEILLTPTQVQAVEEITQPLCIKAGPGTGKTLLLVEKILFLIEQHSVLPTQILALTFTQKAAKELSNRVEKRSKQAFMTYTFHSFALSILQTISKSPEQIKVLKDVDSIYFLQEKIKEQGFHEVLKKDPLFVAKEVYKTINSLRDLGYDVKTISSVKFNSDYSKQIVITLFVEYEKFKSKKKVKDFHDLEQRLYQLLLKKETIAQKISALYPYIIVDEFQDTSPIQFKILTLLASHQSHITIVGDEKQSIYGFRGTHHNSFEEFNSIFSNTKLLYLNEQFRSSLSIVQATNAITTALRVEEEQQLLPQKKDEGAIYEVMCHNEQDQYAHILQEILSNDNNNENSNDSNNKSNNSQQTIAVLARTHFQLKGLIEYCSTYGIHISYGLEDVFNNPAIEKILWYLHIISNPKESQKYILALLETLPIAQCIPQFILHQARAHELDIISFFKKHMINSNSKALDEVKEKYNNDVDVVIHKISFMLLCIEEFQSHRRIRKILLKIMQEEELYERALNLNDTKLLRNYNSLLEFVQEYEQITQEYTLSEFLQYLHTAKELHHNIVDSNPAQLSSHIVAMTIHQAKGKEFDRVFILSCNDKVFPLPFKEDFLKHEHSIVKENSLDEELRLFFVAISRAKEEVQLLVPQFNSKGTALVKSKYLSYIQLVSKTKEVVAHSLEKQSSFSKEILSKLLYALKDNNFKYARELIAEYELRQLKGDDIRAYDEKNVDKVYLPKGEDGVYKKRIYSVSQLKTYETCPKKYYYSYICKIPQEPKHFFSFGTTIHSVFEHIMPMFENGVTYTKEEITMQALHLLSMYWKSLGYESVVQEKEYFLKAIQAIDDFIDKERKRREEGVLPQDLEEEFIIEVKSEDGSKVHQLMGYIDRIDSDSEGKYHILDYKTSKSMAYQSQLQEDLQLYTYALAVKQLKGEFPKSMSLWYVIHNRIAQVTFNEEVMSKCEDKLRKGILQIESNNFDATPSFFGCTYCDFKDICKESLK